MADIVQLKNENGTPVYPVTTGETINMEGGKTLDQVFAEKSEALEADFQSKKNALESDYQNAKSSFAGFYKGDNDSQLEYPVGSIVLARSKFGIPVSGVNSRAFAVYVDSLQGFTVTDPNYTSVLNPGFSKLNGTWSMHGFYTPSTDSEPIFLMQRVS